MLIAMKIIMIISICLGIIGFILLGNKRDKASKAGDILMLIAGVLFIIVAMINSLPLFRSYIKIWMKLPSETTDADKLVMEGTFIFIFMFIEIILLSNEVRKKK